MKVCVVVCCLSVVCLVSGCAVVSVVRDYEDMSNRDLKEVVPGKTYRISSSGICGVITNDHILVTHVIPGTVAHGKIMKGDKIRKLQYRGMGADVLANLQKRVYRLGRDWDWHFYVTVERASLRNGKGNWVTYDLKVPPLPDKEYHFGPTGFFATIHPGYLEVSHVSEKSPSYGKLAVGDHILAVNDKPIAGDLFALFTKEVDRAESQQGKGVLRLKVKRFGAPEPTKAEAPKKRKGKKAVTSPPPKVPRPVPPDTALELSVDLQLKVLGEYSNTSPIDCPKTDLIITRTADTIMASGNYGKLNTGLLALMSTGDKACIEHVGKVIHAAKWAKPDIKLPITAGSVSWYRAYYMIILSEYYLLTGDDYVLPALTTYANTVARGQDAAGLWNHQAASPDANFGKLHGRLYGYGAINQTSVALWIGLILARECGIKDPEVEAAVKKTYDLYSYWIERGKLPYGNHGAGEDFFTNNGTSGSVAVGFALLGDKAGASFFARESAAASEEVLTGHTGPWFNIFWSGIGANVAGPEVTKAYDQTVHWLRTVTRTWDDKFLHAQGWGCKPGDHSLGSSGSTLMNLTAGRRKLRITGRDMDTSIWLDEKAAKTVVGAGAIDYGAKTVDELLGLLGHQLPPVRLRAAEMLAIKDARVEPKVMNLLKSGTRNQRIGAIHAIASLKMDSAVDELMAIVRDVKDDLWIRQLALRKLASFDAAKKHVPELLAMLAGDKSYDVQGRFDEDLGGVLVSLTGADPYSANLDNDLLYKAVGKLLDHKRQGARTSGMSLLKKIPVEDLHRIVDKMIYVIKDTDRTYVSYHGDGHRQTGLDILYGLNIDESLDLTVNTINEKVGRGWRARNRKAMMKTWGGEGKRLIPRIKEVLGKGADEFVKIIEEAKTAKRMIPLEEAVQLGKRK